MGRIFKISAILWLLFGVVQLTIGQVSSAGRSDVGSSPVSFNKISKEEIEILLIDVAASNPEALKKIATESGRKEQIGNLRQLLAFASQAQKEGLLDDPTIRQELENIRSEVTAVNYDKEINKDKGPMAPLGFISHDQVQAFWRDAATARAREDQFEQFLDSKLELLKAGNPQMRDHVISDAEKAQGRDYFAKIQIYKSDYEANRTKLPQELQAKVALHVKLQQAQFLARLYSEKIAARVFVTNEEIGTYISTHPELSTSKQKAKAETILSRARAGEDFIKLANEFSEDPGNKGAGGKLLGGLYTDVPLGRMVPPFERAALTLQPGEISPTLVETDFGYHIIKLEKKNQNSNDPRSITYDVRHILISTTHIDPSDPTSQATPIRQFVLSKLETEKENRIINEIVVANNVQIADDFTIPSASPAAAGTATKAKQTPRKRPVRKRGK